MIRTLATALAAATLVASAQAAPPIPLSTYAKPARLVALPDGRKMNLFCLGSGSPTIMLDSGFGGFSSSWAKVQPTLAERTQTCSYDRAGMGFSDPGPMPRDVTTEVADQRALLKAAGIKGPIVLVVHSMAGLNARVFASTYPREIAGMVLVDPSNPYQVERMAKTSPARRAALLNGPTSPAQCRIRLATGEVKVGDPDFPKCVRPPPADLPEDLRTVIVSRQGDVYRYATLRSEFDAMGGSSSVAVEKTKRKLGDLPLIVLTASGTTRDPALPPADQEALHQLWSSMHDEISVLSTRGENRQVESGHGIPNEKPEAVVTAVDDVLAQIVAKH